MTRSSKKYFGENFKKSVWNLFLFEAKKLKSENDVEKFLGKFFTADEKNCLEKRLAIMSMLRQDNTYKKISEEVDVTPATISFVKNGLKRKKSVKRKWSEGKYEKRASRKPNFPTYRGSGRWRFLNN